MNASLEQRVQERTADLKSANLEISSTLEKLKAAQSELVESEKIASLGGLVAGIAHEINTPIGIGVTAASHFREMTEDFAKTYRAGGLKRSALEDFIGDLEQTSRIILGNFERAADLVRSFKQVAVDQSNDDRRQFGGREYLDNVVLSPRPKWKKICDTVDVDCDEGLIIEGFPGSLSQIVTNLIVNSTIHAYDEGARGQLRISARLVGQTFELEYSDDGKGMAEDVRKRIFDPFFTTRRGTGGSGLGMHLVYNIVTGKFGGRIECLSKPGEGAKFLVSWPVSSALAATPAGRSSAA